MYYAPKFAYILAMFLAFTSFSAYIMLVLCFYVDMNFADNTHCNCLILHKNNHNRNEMRVSKVTAI